MDNRRTVVLVSLATPMAKNFSNQTLALLSPRASSMLSNSNRKTPSNEVSKKILQMRCKRADKQLWIAAAKLAVQRGIIVADKRGTLAPWVVYTLTTAAKRSRTKSA